MLRTLGRSLLGISLTLLCATLVQAAAGDKPTKKDPVEEVFTLPKTAKLDADQQAAFDKLRAEKEPELKAAWEQYQSAKSTAEKSAGMKKFNEVKKETKSAIAKILHPSSGSKKPKIDKPVRDKPIVTKPKREPITKPKKEKPIRPGQLPPGAHPPAGGGF